MTCDKWDGYGWVCCTGTCDLFFDPFDSTLSGYTEHEASSTNVPTFARSGGNLYCGANDPATDDGAISQTVDAGPFSSLSLFVEARVLTTSQTWNNGVENVTWEPSTAGVMIGLPYYLPDTEGEPWATLVWRPNTCSALAFCSAGPAYYCDLPGDVTLFWGDGSETTGQVVVKAGVPLGARLRLEMHVAAIGPPPLVDLHCYVDNVLTHVECDVDVSGISTTTLPVGMICTDGGRWDDFCVGVEYLAKTRHCTHTPNVYELRIPVGTTDDTAALPCMTGIIAGGTWQDIVGGNWVWYLTKVGGDATSCVYECWVRTPGVPRDDGGSGDCAPTASIDTVLRLTITGSGPYTLALEVSGSDGTTTKYQTYRNDSVSGLTGAAILNHVFGESDCDHDGLASLTVTANECGSVGLPPTVATECCPDEDLPATLGGTATLQSSYDGSVTLSDLVADPDGEWNGTVTFTPNNVSDPCSAGYPVTLRCVFTEGEPTPHGWVLVIDGQLIDATSYDCDPLSIVFPVTIGSGGCSGVMLEIEITE